MEIQGWLTGGVIVSEGVADNVGLGLRGVELGLDLSDNGVA